jgi:shikimate kinase
LLARNAAAGYCIAMAALKRTVALIGMMGAGKSSIGRRLASRLGAPFHDADSEIEAAAGCTINEIFARFGETEFRDGERRVILRLLGQPPHVLATGGGAILDATTRAQIAQNAVSVWLRAPLDLLLARVGRRDSRPLLKSGNAREKLERLLAEREPFYAQANVVIDAANGPHGVAVERILAALAGMGVVDPQ